MKDPFSLKAKSCRLRANCFCTDKTRANLPLPAGRKDFPAALMGCLRENFNGPSCSGAGVKISYPHPLHQSFSFDLPAALA